MMLPATAWHLMRRATRRLGCAVLLGSWFAPPVSADPIVIRSGLISTQDSTTSGFVQLVLGMSSFQADTELTASRGLEPWRVSPWLGCGDSVSCSPVLLPLGPFAGTASINGTKYHGVAFQGQLRLDHEPLFIPRLDPGVDTEATVPFNASAEMSVFTCVPGTSCARLGERVFHGTLTGRGMVRSYATYSFGLIDDLNIDYSFSETPAPVPEPGTILLVASGCIVFGRRVMRRRRVTPEAQSLGA